MLLQINWGPLESLSTPNLGSTTVGKIISEFLKYLFPAAGLILLLYLIYGGYEIMFSAGKPEKIQGGKDRITGALVGFIIIFVAYWLVQAIGLLLFGYNGPFNAFS